MLVGEVEVLPIRGQVDLSGVKVICPDQSITQRFNWGMDWGMKKLHLLSSQKKSRLCLSTAYNILCGFPRHVELEERTIKLALTMILEGRTPKWKFSSSHASALFYSFFGKTWILYPAYGEYARLHPSKPPRDNNNLTENTWEGMVSVTSWGNQLALATALRCQRE